MHLREPDFTDLKIPTYVLLSSDLTAEQKLLYALIYNFRDEKGYFDLNKEMLVRAMKCPYPRIVKNYEELERMSYIVIDYDHNGRQKYGIRIYPDP